MNITLAVRGNAHQNIQEPHAILLQGTQDMQLSRGAKITNAWSPARLGLLVQPGRILTGVRVQARVRQRQSYNSWAPFTPQRSHLRFRITVNVRGSGQSPDDNITENTTPGRILQRDIGNLVFSEILEPNSNNWNDSSAFNNFDNYIDEYFEILPVEIANEIYVFFQVFYGSNGWDSISNEDVEIYSLTFDHALVGCDGVQVRSLDGRLISTSGNKEITYPILFLGREPVREDAQGFKEVLVFQDRATRCV